MFLSPLINAAATAGRGYLRAGMQNARNDYQGLQNTFGFLQHPLQQGQENLRNPQNPVIVNQPQNKLPQMMIFGPKRNGPTFGPQV